jgi:hypothetical protein
MLSAPLDKRLVATLAAAAVLSSLALAFNLHFALLDRIDVPLVDGWPVLHRIMALANHEISWSQYLFSPHGAHLHSIIYAIALFDFRFLGGQQELQTAFSFLAIIFYTIFVAGLLVSEGIRQGRHSAEIVLAASAAAALLSSISDTETMLIPFQAVLTVSRLVYIGLLYACCVAILQDRRTLYAMTLLAALPAVTFHGTGHLFAFCIILIHVLLRQRLPRLLVSCLPLLFALMVQSYYSASSGELSNLGQVLKPAALTAVPLAFAAYFASPFAAFLHIFDNRLMLIPGALLALSTIVLTLLGLREILGIRGVSPAAWWRQYRTPASGSTSVHPGVVLFTILGLLLIMSGAAAAVFWFIRSAGGPTQPWQLVFSSTRYGAYAALASLMPIAALLHGRRFQGQRTAGPWITSVAAMAVLALGLGGTIRMASILTTGDRVNLAMAAMSIGLPPTLPQTEAVWPGANQDWFWSTELPRTVNWLRQIQRGPWRDLPSLHTRGGPSFAAYPLNGARWEPLPMDTAPGWCKLNAALPSWGRALSPESEVVPVTTADGVVAGFAVMARQSAARANRVLEGYVGCSQNGMQLFMPRDETR